MVYRKGERSRSAARAGPPRRTGPIPSAMMQRAPAPEAGTRRVPQGFPLEDTKEKPCRLQTSATSVEVLALPFGAMSANAAFLRKPLMTFSWGSSDRTTTSLLTPPPDDRRHASDDRDSLDRDIAHLLAKAHQGPDGVLVGTPQSIRAPAEANQEDAIAGFVVVNDEGVAVGDVLDDPAPVTEPSIFWMNAVAAESSRRLCASVIRQSSAAAPIGSAHSALTDGP